MPLPKKFYDAEGNEIRLEKLCKQEPEWAANNIRCLHHRIDELNELLESSRRQAHSRRAGRGF